MFRCEIFYHFICICMRYLQEDECFKQLMCLRYINKVVKIIEVMLCKFITKHEGSINVNNQNLSCYVISQRKKFNILSSGSAKTTQIRLCIRTVCILSMDDLNHIETLKILHVESSLTGVNMKSQNLNHPKLCRIQDNAMQIDHKSKLENKGDMGGHLLSMKK